MLPPCLLLRSPRGYVARVALAFTLHQLLLGQSTELGAIISSATLSVARGLRFVLLPLMLVLSLLPLGFQKLAVVETSHTWDCREEGEIFLSQTLCLRFYVLCQGFPETTLGYCVSISIL